MIKLKDILKEKKKPVNEIVGMLTFGALMKYLVSWSKKNPSHINKLKKFINKL